MTEIWRYGASDLAAMIRSGRLSSREVIEAHLERIDQRKDLNAITRLLAKEALEAADAVDRGMANGDDPGPLAGVPFTIKENIDVAGSPTTFGVSFLERAVPWGDAPHIAELRAAGAIPIARSNMPEFGMRWHTDNDLFGATSNPWSEERTPGGSSGGEACAVASGMSPLGMGNDGAGSLRWPAQCCGVAALKPSFGRVATVSRSRQPQPLPFAFQLLGVHGPMARHTKDLRLAFSHMCGRSGGDPWHVPATLELPAHETPIRVTYDPSPAGVPVDSRVTSSLEKAADRLTDAGYIVELRAMPSLERANQIYYQIMNDFGRMGPDPAAFVSTLSEGHQRFWQALGPSWLAAAGEPAFDAMAERRTIALEWHEWMTSHPLILAPIASEPAFPVASECHPAWTETWLDSLRAIVVVNLLGLPAVAVPTGLEEELPGVVQIIGPRFREDLCLDAAQAIEERVEVLTPI